MMKVALVGNQNCGKTTLFNALTGAHQHVGNFPGVTVDVKVGFLKQNQSIAIVDLPGIYSLSPYSHEEIIARDYIVNEKPDLIVNIIDATNIERSLYLSLQLMELGLPMLLALNMIDEVRNSGNSIDIKAFEKKIGVQVVSLSAIKDEGITDLVSHIERIGNEHSLPSKRNFYFSSKATNRAIHATMNLIKKRCLMADYPLQYASTRLIEGDEILEKQLQLSDSEKRSLGDIILKMEKETGLDRQATLAIVRYDFIEEITNDIVLRTNTLTKEQLLSKRIDCLLTNKWLAFPLFILIMGLVFYLSFGLIGYYLSQWFDSFLHFIVQGIDSLFISFRINDAMRSLIVDGILNGINSVLAFLPTIVVLFFFLSLLEDSGYMARIAFIMDKPLQRIGLSGRSFVPLLIGFGCSVPAVMATRTLTSKRDKMLTIFAIPFMSCSAKLPIYSVLTSAFFGANSVWVMILLYITGIAMSIFLLALFQAIKKEKSTSFILELPSYRMPSLKSTFLLMKEKAQDFIKKAFSVIFIATVVIWFLQSFDWRFNYVSDNSQSILGIVAARIAPLFKPLGLNDWRLVSALMAGLSAKEAVVSSLEVLIGGNLSVVLPSTYTSLQGLSLLVFILLYMPCIATFATIRQELHSTKWTILYMMGQTGLAYFISLVIYQIGLLII